jgi:hypothetical protein
MLDVLMVIGLRVHTRTESLFLETAVPLGPGHRREKFISLNVEHFRVGEGAIRHFSNRR